ncbi:AraC-like DNA-binding protein [Paenibacillus eucommiae]|uniref:AraC-like DNA-binding protein n=2 Tax=Paenibacillus eucommiae TaxID=1355755 RepID=A0ABS4IXE5_9BACL|nr:AraC-like DNA-binding protein [Paenibacillus eucommiae]
MNYKRYKLREEIMIRSLVTCYYYELSKTFKYSGEKHNFWELLYVDKGEIEVETDSGYYAIKQGDLLFHEPNEFHRLKSNGKIAPNIFVVSFVCNSNPMAYFANNKLFHLGDYERSILAQLMKEGLDAFGPNPTDSSPKVLSFKKEASFASEQLFKISLEAILIQLIRKEQKTKHEKALSTSTRENQAIHFSEKIIKYLEENLHKKITLDHLCAEFGIGRTQINIIFKKTTGIGLIEYVNQLKIDHAKIYIREEAYNITEIAELLGYSSVHYFSRHFKKATDMTPSEYSKTLKAHTFV